MTEREDILHEIRRTAEENGGKPLGQQRFSRETGIRPREWSGRFWARWSDALKEAGFEPNTFGSRTDDGSAIALLVDETRRLGRFPTDRERTLRRRRDPTFPSDGVFKRFGSRQALAARVAAYCQEHSGHEDVLSIVQPLLTDEPRERSKKRAEAEGYVYLLKAGRYYKIGRTNAAGRRERELAIQLPERASRVHVIKTDDPVGIERYWHLRFADRRVRPDAEWFDLTNEDIAVFKRRTFQ